MKKIINIHYALPILFFVLVGVFSLNAQNVSITSIFDLPTAEAFGGSGGPGGGGPSGGGGGGNDSGCGGCGGGSTGGGSFGGGGGGGDNNSFFTSGCTDPAATNYNPSAFFDDGSCILPPVVGCMDIFATNYNPKATVNDSSLCEYPEEVVTSCKLSASATTIDNGSSVTLSWQTEGFDNFKLNGQSISGNNGSKTFNNVTVNTTYTLVATNSNGDPCQSIVNVKCLPPVVEKECKLDINKSVNKNSANVGDEVTYTINVKNTGNANCTGGGVKIFDIVDHNLVYKSHNLTSNLSAGYGNKPVYSSSDRTLRFNGNTLTPGESGTITWIGKIANPNQCGDFVVKNQAKTTAKELNNFQTWVYSQTVKTNVDNDCVTPLPKCDYFTATPTSLPYGGGNVTLKWATTNATNVSISGIGSVSADNTTGRSVSVPSTRTFVLTATNSQGTDKSCVQKVTVQPKVDKPLPSCDSFSASPTSFAFGGGDVTLKWETTNATNVSISGIGNVALDNQNGRVVSVPTTRTFVLTATNSQGEDKSCVQKVTVLPKEDKPLPKCDFFKASPTSFSYGGGDVTLKWGTTNATQVSISGVGTVAADNSAGRVVAVNSTRTFVLTATNSEGTDKSCVQKVTVGEPEPVFSCSNNVNFSVSDSSIRRGDSVNLKWSTSNVDSLTISHINKTALSGNQSVSPSSDITYTLKAKQGNKTINCPVTVRVTSGGGGGGGTPTPRCDLDISDKKIKVGESVTLRWDTSNANGVTIKDDRGKTIFTTDEYLSKDKEQYYDSSIKVKPTRDTKYTLTAGRGSRDRDCSVKVQVGDSDVVVLEDRDQLPLVSGISLTQVPYTGFEAGPFMTSLFYVLLVAWSLFITYLLVVRNRVAPIAVKTYGPAATGTTSKDSMKKAEAVRPDAFAPSVMTKVVASQTTPTNLPTGMAVAGQDVMKTQVADVNPDNDTVATALENRAHAQKALLSSDAVRYFITSTVDSSERDETLDQVIVEAKKTYPLEDGWIVINQARMQSLCETCVTTAVATAESATPAGASSLAEAIVTGNVVAAYQMIGHRPMIALADAAADLDAVYRNRQGESNSVSQMLSTETQNLSDGQISEMIAALTGALDGTYTDEASAVKMSIMKAVKVAA